LLNNSGRIRTLNYFRIAKKGRKELHFGGCKQRRNYPGRIREERDFVRRFKFTKKYASIRQKMFIEQQFSEVSSDDITVENVVEADQI